MNPLEKKSGQNSSSIPGINKASPAVQGAVVFLYRSHAEGLLHLRPRNWAEILAHPAAARR